MTDNGWNMTRYGAHRSGSPFVGRSVELDRLSRMLAVADDCHVRTAFITGESGVGKTRLAQEFAHQAASDGWQVWKVHADSTNKQFSFSSLMEVFRVALTQLSLEERTSLAESVPNVNLLFPDLDGAYSGIERDVRWDRIQLFETFRLMAMKLTQQRPAVVWFDDFPDSDPETMSWLHYFTRYEQQTCMVFVATCRTPIAEATHEYQKLRTTLMRHHQLEEIELKPFDIRETTSLAKKLLLGDVKDSVPQLLQDRARGIPLFTVELIRMLTESNQLVVDDGKWCISARVQHEVPQAVTAVIAERLGHLSTLQKKILNLVAISDAALPWTVLQKAAATAASESLVYALSHLVQLGILDETPSAADILYSFSHPMMQEVVQSGISLTTSRYLHRVLSTAWSQNPLRAAHHIRISGSMADVKEAVDLLVQAGRHHLSMRAYQLAREHLEMATTMLKTSPAAPSSIEFELEQEAKILLCEAWAYSEQVSDALEMLGELIMQASSSAWKIRIHRLMASIESTRFVANCILHIEEGLRGWDGQTENEDVFWMLNEQMFNYLNAGATEDAQRILRMLRHYCELYPSSKHALVLAIREAHIQLVDWRQRQLGVRDLSSLTMRARALGDPEWIYDAYGLVGYASLTKGDHQTTVRYWKECRQLVQRYGMATYEYALTLMGACGLFLSGDWDEALAELKLVERMAREYSIDLALAAALDQQSLIYALRGQWSEARHCTTESHEVTARAFSHHLGVNEERHLHAVSALELMFRDNALRLPGEFEELAVVWANVHGLPIFMKLLEGMLQIRAGNLQIADKLITQLLETAGDAVNYAKGVADLLAGFVNCQRGETRSAMERLEYAIQTFESLNIPLEGAVARLKWSTLAASENPEAAEVQAQAALTVYARLDAKPLIHRATVVLQTIQVQRTAVSMSSATVDALSEREREIVSYISKGLSNKEVAKALVLSRRTVDAHLNNVYKKLGVHSRTGLLHKLNFP